MQTVISLACVKRREKLEYDLREIVTSRNEVHNEVGRRIHSEILSFVHLTTLSETQWLMNNEMERE